MIEIKKFDNWIPDKEKLDSGKGKKVWLTSPYSIKICGWFKYVKVTHTKNNTNDDTYTYENISEKLAELIAKELKINSAKIDIGTYHNDLGCLSYNILAKDQKMSEGISYISRSYPKYDSIKGYDPETKKYYCLDIILNSLSTDILKKEFLKIMMFDFLIGNSDRHSNNWAIIKNKNNTEFFAPLYDNGSSLCALINEDTIDTYLGNDKMKFTSIVDSKSRTLIRIDGNVYKIPTHKDVLNYIRTNYYEDTKDFAQIIINTLTEAKIDNILTIVKEFISDKRYKLLKKYLLAKINILKEIYERGDSN